MCWPNVSFMNIYCLFITGLLEVQMQWMQTLFTVLEMLCKSEAFEFVFTILFRGKVNRTQDNLRPASQTASVGETHPLVRPDWLFAAAAGAACTQISVMAPAESCGKAALCRQAIPAHTLPRAAVWTRIEKLTQGKKPMSLPMTYKHGVTPKKSSGQINTSLRNSS